MSKKTQAKPKPQQLRVGDRFRWDGCKAVWEYVDDDKDDFVPHQAVCVKRGEGWEVGDIAFWNFTSGFAHYTYLGNFSKSDNFEELYNLLNESTE